MTPDRVVLVAVNHGETRRRGRVTAFRSPVAVEHAIDRVTTEPLGVNARAGEWTIAAFDRLSTREAVAKVRVR